MGIEQILLPILGGIAKGTGEGLEQRRQQRVQMEAQRNVGMAKTFREKPELYEVPEFRNWANKYYGPQEAKAMYSSARIEKLQNQYLTDERVRTGNPNPEPLSPDQMPPEPQFADFSGGGNRGGIAGLISKFLPGVGAGMSALGLGGPGAAQAQTPQPSTGPPSGPQGYAPAGGWQQAQGAAPAPQVPPAALSEMDQRIGVPAISQIPITKVVATPGGGATLTIAGTPPPRGTRSAFTRERPQKIAKGVTIRFDKDGNQLVSMTAVDTDLSANMNEVSRRLIDARRKARGEQPLDMDNADDIQQVLDYGNELSLKVLASKNALTDEQKLRMLENPRNIQAQRNLAASKAGGGLEGTLGVEMDPNVQRFRGQEKFQSAEQTTRGTAAGENLPIVDASGSPIVFDAAGNPMTKNQMDTAQRVNEARQVEQNKVLDTVTQKKLDGMKGMLSSVDRIWQNYDPKFLGAIQGTTKALKWREITGLSKGPESVMRQTLTTLSNLKIQDLTGAGVTHEDGIRILAELPSPQDSPDVFVAKLTNFQTMLGEALERAQQGATEPRSAQSPVTSAQPLPTKTPTPVSASTSARTPPINKDKKSKFYGQPMNTRADVPLNDPNATRPVYQLPASSFGPNGKLTRQALEALQRAQQAGELPEDFDIQTIPDEEFQKAQGAR